MIVACGSLSFMYNNISALLVSVVMEGFRTATRAAAYKSSIDYLIELLTILTIISVVFQAKMSNIY